MLSILLLSIWFQVSLTVSINEWYGGFYNILQKATEHKIGEFWDQMILFSYLAFPYVIIASTTAYLSRIYAFKWREEMTYSFSHAFSASDANIEGASQRIQEDAYRFAKIVESIGLQIVKAIMTLIAFVPLLFSLSTHAQIPYFEGISGSLVYIALAVSLGGLVLSWLIGIKLPGLEYQNQKTEASFRKELVFAEDNRADFASADVVQKLFTDIKKNYQKLFLHYGYFDVWLNFFEQIMVIVPYLIMAPALFSGAIMLGTLVQVSNAFSKVRESFSVFINNWTSITELRSIHKRLKEFEISLTNKNTQCV